MKPMLDDLELQLVQDEVLAGKRVQQRVPVAAMEGGFLKDHGRVAETFRLRGVLTGPEAGDGLRLLREKFRRGLPLDFVADIAVATRIDRVLIEDMSVRELAGRPDRYEYSFSLREVLPAPVPSSQEGEPEAEQANEEENPPADDIAAHQGTLIVEVLAPSQTAVDFASLRVAVQGKNAAGEPLERELLTRDENLWTERELPASEDVYTASVMSRAEPLLVGSETVAVRAGQTARVTVTLAPSPAVAAVFAIHFRFDNAFVEPCMRRVLGQVAAFAAANPDQKLLVVGHTDKTGSSSYNQGLSERRARSAFAYLSFGRDRQAAREEWEQLRLTRSGGNALNDQWNVREYQHMLQDLGFYPGGIDGDHGPTTDAAVRAYRCHKGLPPGTDVDDDVWTALIADYLGQDNFAVPGDRFLANCSDSLLQWLGCGEEDPILNTPNAWRPNRRTEFLFLRVSVLPCEVPKPQTFDLPPLPEGATRSWCLDQGNAASRCCFVTPAAEPCPTQSGTRLCRPAKPPTFRVEGSIRRETRDSTGVVQLLPETNRRFVLTAPDGEFKQGERGDGLPQPARTNASGDFAFDGLPPGFYSVEVVNQPDAVLVRLAEDGDGDVKGNSVCKRIDSSADRLDIVIIDAPVLVEIRLPVVAHIMTPLNSETHQIRVCNDMGGNPLNQNSGRTDAQLRGLFVAANSVWRQARIRFEPVEIVREAYEHPLNDPGVRGSCEVDNNEFRLLTRNCNGPGLLNVYFFAVFQRAGLGGVGISFEDGVATGINPGAGVADRFHSLLGTQLLDAAQSAQVLAHELGHILNLEHTGETPGERSRLLFPATLDGGNLELIEAERARARASLAATDDCVPLTLTVAGAIPFGGGRFRFIIIRDPNRRVTVDAQIPAALLAPERGTLVMNGGAAGGHPLQRVVNADPIGVTEVSATYTPVGGTPVTERVSIRVVDFSLNVAGALPVGNPVDGRFVAFVAAGQQVRVVALIQPSPFCLPDDLIVWQNGDPAADPRHRLVSRDNAVETVVRATVAGQNLQVTLQILADPAVPGPFPVGEFEYPETGTDLFSLAATTETISEEADNDLEDLIGLPSATRDFINGAFQVNLRALVRYPARAGGSNQPVSTDQADYPLVILAHGNHRSLYPDNQRVENFRGLEYLARHLASHGYVAVSVDLDDLNIEDPSATPLVGESRSPAILQRGRILLEHIRVMSEYGAGTRAGAVDFSGTIDLARIALIGHSRGGEAVVSAQRTNVDEGRGLTIRGVVSIAPTDFLGTQPAATPYFLIYGSADGDVSTGMPFRLYDRAQPEKAMVFAYGGIHNRFSTHPDWNGLPDPRVSVPYVPRRLDSADPRRLSGDDHLELARGYGFAFLEWQLLDRSAWELIFKHFRQPDSMTGVELHHQYQDTLRNTVDDFQQGTLDRLLPLPPQLATRASTNTRGQAVTVASLEIPNGFTAARTEASLSRRDLEFFHGETVGAMMAWDSTAGAYISQLGGFDAGSFAVFSFRVTQRLGSTHVTPGAAVDFRVFLVDTAGASADLQVSTFAAIPFPFVRRDERPLPRIGPDFLNKSALKTVRIPLSAFTEANSGLNLSTLARVMFRFNETPEGEIAVDDLEFSN